MADNMRAPLGRWSAATLVMQLTTGVGGFIFLLVTARALGPEARGILVVFTTTVTLCVAVCGLGVPNSVLHYVGRGADLRGLFRQLRPLILIGSLLAFVCSPLAFFLGVGLAVSFSVWAAVVILAVLATGAATILQWLGLGLGRFTCVARARAGSIVALAASVFLLGQVGLLTPLIAAVSWTLMWVLYGLRLYRELRPWTQQVEAQGMGATPVRFALHSFPSAVGDSLGARLAQWLVALLSGTFSAGIYSVALGISEVILLPAQALGASLFAGESRRELGRFPIKPIAFALGASALTASVVFAIGPWGIQTLFGESYRGAVTPMLVLAAGTLPLAAQRVLGPYLAGRGHPAYYSAASLVTAGALAIAVSALVPRYGALGAAYGSTIGYIAGAALLATALMRSRSRVDRAAPTSMAMEAARR